MPMSSDFCSRLFANLEKIAQHYSTPFHIYDEKGIMETGELVKKAFSGVEVFREYYAVKALPNPKILQLMAQLGFGFDCSSIPEIVLARKIGARGDEIMFTSNNTSREEFLLAEQDGGCILNLDDITLIDKVPHMPEAICFRYNPGSKRDGNDIIGKPEEAKYGVSHDQIIEAYQKAIARGAKKFGLHTMLASNELNYTYMVQTAEMLLELVEEISSTLSITIDFINIGGGMGIPYHPDQNPLDILSMGKEISAHFQSFKEKNGYMPALFMESGRYMTGPHGALVTRAINRKEIYRTYVGVDACMSSLMRPAMYGSYHHVDVLSPTPSTEKEVVDVVGSLCENNDKFAIQRKLPKVTDGDLIVIHDTGAHGHAMGFNYNGKMRPRELLLRSNGTVEQIRREETMEDYFATLSCDANTLVL